MLYSFAISGEEILAPLLSFHVGMSIFEKFRRILKLTFMITIAMRAIPFCALPYSVPKLHQQAVNTISLL